jgi:hypothetical protein
MELRITNAFRHAIELVRNPAAYMTRNKDLSVTLNALIINYVAIVALVPLVATLVGDTLYYSSRFTRHNVIAGAVGVAIVTYILQIIGVLIVGAVIWKLVPYFASKTDQTRATVLAAYGYTPVALIAIVDFIPQIAFLTVLGLLYGLYIAYVGLPILIGTPKDRVLTYLIAIIIAAFVVYAVVYYLTVATVHSAL